DDYANVNAKDPVLVFQDTTHLEIEINVPERDFTVRERKGTREEVRARLKPEVIVSAIPNRSFPARIKEWTTDADPETRTFQVTFVFDNPKDVRIFPGMTAKVRVTAWWTPHGIRIPATAALADANGTSYVWLVDPSSMTVRRAPVDLGELTGSKVEVLSGLSKGDQIAISGVHQLREGVAVRRYEGRTS
ncbi:MAG: efflux RND transporter periplasmic adaptor subunit, partial [Candidatus Methylomirabilales bacterium]